MVSEAKIGIGLLLPGLFSCTSGGEFETITTLLQSFTIEKTWEKYRLIPFQKFNQCPPYQSFICFWLWSLSRRATDNPIKMPLKQPHRRQELHPCQTRK